MKHKAIAILVAILGVAILAGCATKPAPVPEPTPAPQPQPEPAPQPEPTPQPQPEPIPQPEPQPIPPPPPPPPPPPVRETSAFQAQDRGFSPSSVSRVKGMKLSLLIGNKDLVKTWQVDIVGDTGTIRRFAGTSAQVPTELTWDGRKDNGEAATEGWYSAALDVDYGEVLEAVKLSSKRFFLSITIPEPALRADPARFEPSPEGVKAPVVFYMTAKESLSRIESWSIVIVGPDGLGFRTFNGVWPVESVTWDGKSGIGLFVEVGEHYTAVLGVQDEFGNSASTRISVEVSSLPFPSEKSAVQPWTAGFSPNGDKVMDTIEFKLVFGNREAVQGWKVELGLRDQASVKTFTGSAPTLPDTISWDGKDDKGALAPEGRYTPTLSLDYGKSFVPASVSGPSFMLDVTPPKVSLEAGPSPFSPDGDGINDLLDLKLDASSDLARITDWTIEVLEPEGQLFASLQGSWPAMGGPIQTAWDGSSGSGQSLESADSYPIVAKVRDQFGNTGEARSEILTDIFVIKIGDRYKINVTGVVFKGYTDDYLDVLPERAAQNIKTLDLLATRLERFPEYKILLVGHAVMIYWDDPDRGRIEQEEVLIPLSKARAVAIAKALAERGIDPARMSTAGLGATDQIVPDGDELNRWKNRRVEFYLERK
jgi:hypothetical protein